MSHDRVPADRGIHGRLIGATTLALFLCGYVAAGIVAALSLAVFAATALMARRQRRRLACGEAWEHRDSLPPEDARRRLRAAIEQVRRGE